MPKPTKPNDLHFLQSRQIDLLNELQSIDHEMRQIKIHLIMTANPGDLATVLERIPMATLDKIIRTLDQMNQV